MAKVKEILQHLDVRPSKQRGQNFVIHPGVINSIAQFGRPQATEKIVEIGPGLGALTSALSVASDLTLIEIEPEFCRKLAAQYPNAKIINEDFRGVDLRALGKPLTVFGNVPYSFSTDIIFTLVAYNDVVTRAVLLLQKEFAERIAAEPGSRQYSAITVAVALRADSRLGPIISGDCFHPPTEVESQVLELHFLSKPRCDVGDEFWFSSVVRASFQQRRKKILNSLGTSKLVPMDMLQEAFTASNIDPNSRPEMLTLEEFAALSRELWNRKRDQ